MQPVGVTPPWHGAAGKFIDNHHLTVLDQVVHITLEQEMGRLSGVTNVATVIDDTLRPQHLPSATMTYTLAAESDEQESVAGYQVAFFDQDATNLIILTFTTQKTRMGDLVKDFEQIVRSVILS